MGKILICMKENYYACRMQVLLMLEMLKQFMKVYLLFTLNIQFKRLVFLFNIACNRVFYTSK